MYDPDVATAVMGAPNFSVSVRRSFSSDDRAGDGSTGRHAVFSPGIHSHWASDPISTATRRPLAPAGTFKIRRAEKFGRLSFKPDQDSPPSIERHTPKRLAAVISSGSRGDTAASDTVSPSRPNPGFSFSFARSGGAIPGSLTKLHCSKSTVSKTRPDFVCANRCAPSLEYHTRDMGPVATPARDISVLALPMWRQSKA